MTEGVDRVKYTVYTETQGQLNPAEVLRIQESKLGTESCNTPYTGKVGIGVS